MPFSGDALEKGPLGGTETALIGVSRALAANPLNQVRIFTNTPSSHVAYGVNYAPLNELAAFAASHEIDVLVSLRQWVPFVLPIRSRCRIYFSPDAWDQPFLNRAFEVRLGDAGNEAIVPFLEPRVFMSAVDAFFCVGQWQAETFVSKLKFPGDRIFVTANGYFPESFSPKPLHERKPRLVYSSTPFRGLSHLPRLFHQIKTDAPQSELEVCSSMGVYGVTDKDDEAAYGALYRELSACGAVSHGSIRQKELADILCSARVFAYPNTFAETFCIAVLEAQAAGLPVVTSKLGALPERVTDGVDGFLIDGIPGEPDYDRDFTAACTRLMNDDALWGRMSLASQAKATGFTYETLARSWEIKFAELVSGKDAALPRTSDLAALDSWTAVLPKGPKYRFDQKTIAHFLNQAAAVYGF